MNDGMVIWGIGRNMMLCLDGGVFNGWIFHKHPDGQWVSIRKATTSEIVAICAKDADNCDNSE